MTLEEIKTRLDNVTNSTPENDKMFIKTLMSSIYNMNQVEATDLFEMYESSLIYNNYITEKEYMTFINQIINYDGTKGGKVRDFNSFFKVIPGAVMECKPYYNTNALKLMINIIISDYGDLLVEMAGADATRYNTTAYKMAVNALKDPDNVRNLRNRYGL